MTLFSNKPFAFVEFGEGICLAKDHEIAILIMKDNKYVNATQLCKRIMEMTNGTKTYRQWKNLKSTAELISDLSLAENIPVNNLFVQFTLDSFGTRTLAGEYVHPKLIPHIVKYVSDTAMATKIANIMTAYDNKP